jgi:beta-phosphoglucomutase-like phosphatase (HAD superfamily)
MYTILFDLDGVLLNSSAIHEESFKSSFADHNLEFRFDYKDIAGLSTKDAIYKILKNKEMKNETISSLISTKQEYAKKLFSELKSVPVFPGVVKGLNMLQEFYTMALCTSASQATVDFFFRSPIKKEWFDLILSSKDVVQSKPNPDIYLEAMRRMKVKPFDCVIIEDSIAGLVAAQISGAKVIRFTSMALSEQRCLNFDSEYPEFTEFEVLTNYLIEEFHAKNR